MRLRPFLCVVSSAFAIAVASAAPSYAESLVPLQAGGQSHVKKKRGPAEGEVVRPIQPGTNESGTNSDAAPGRRPAPTPRAGDCAKCVFF